MNNSKPYIITQVLLCASIFLLIFGIFCITYETEMLKPGAPMTINIPPNPNLPVNPYPTTTTYYIPKIVKTKPFEPYGIYFFIIGISFIIVGIIIAIWKKVNVFK
jgi:hypothetical protein